MNAETYIIKVAESAEAAGYVPVQKLAPSAGRELRMLDFVCFARQVGASFQYFGVRPGDGLVRDQLRALTNQFHNAGTHVHADVPGIAGIQTVAVLACERAPESVYTRFLLGRASPRWPFGHSRSTPVIMDLTAARLLAPWFMAKAVGRSLLESCART